MSNYNKKEIIASIVIELIAIVASIYGIIVDTTGWVSFTYFTILSNIAVDVALLIFLIANIRLLVSDGKVNMKTNALYITKYIMTVSITITFLVFMFILAPTSKNGFLAAYFNKCCGSFCLHFVNPLLAIIDFLLFDYEYKSNKKHCVFAIIPALVYLGFVVIAGYSGMRWKDMYAPYNFINFGAPTGWFGFDLSQMSSSTLGIGAFYMIIVLIIFFLALGALYLKLKDMRKKQKSK